MTDKELIQQALDALELLEKDIEWHRNSPTRKVCVKAITALRSRLEQPAAWVGLTFDSIEACFPESATSDTATGGVVVSAQWLHDFAHAIEAKLKEKNT